MAMKITAKGKPRGIVSLFVGYSLGHSTRFYIMLNPKTNRLRDTHDVTLMKRMNYRKPQHVCELIVREENNDEARESIAESVPPE